VRVPLTAKSFGVYPVVVEAVAVPFVGELAFLLTPSGGVESGFSATGKDFIWEEVSEQTTKDCRAIPPPEHSTVPRQRIDEGCVRKRVDRNRSVGRYLGLEVVHSQAAASIQPRVASGGACRRRRVQQSADGLCVSEASWFAQPPG